MNRRTNFTRIASLLFSFLFVFMLVYSLYYVEVHTDHQCTGQVCSTCAHLSLAHKVLSQMDAATFASSLSVFLILFCKKEILNYFLSRSERTLVTDKVRLDA